MMVISIFTLPQEGKTWAECKTGDICDCLTYEYEKHWNGAGTFTIELPISSRFRSMVEVNSVLVTDSGDALIVKNIQTTINKVKITGYDLNGLLYDRLTMYSGDDPENDGSDECKGTTEYCVKHYVGYNLAACDKDAGRNLPRFGVTENLDRGDPEDSHMPRLQNVHDVVTEMCGAAGLGWRIYINENIFSGDTDSPIFLFDVAEQTDRSVNQSDRNRVIFSVQQHNVSEMTREVGITAAKNALYLDIDGTIQAYPQEGDNSGRTVAVGYARREEYCALTGKSLEPEEYRAEAEHNMADRMNETDSLTIDAGSPLDYGKLYDVGTVVTVYDRERSLQLDSVISAATVRMSGTEYSVKLTLGESKPKLLDQYAKKSDVVSRIVRNNVNSAGTLIPLTEYEYLTDLSAKCNGVTYTIEKDADTGLVSKISDSNGNWFEPTINSGITDVALHNAVFWAVAMCRGFGKKIYGNTNIFDMSNVVNGVWKNSGNGYDIILSDTTVITEEGINIRQYVKLPITGDLYDFTEFVVVKKDANVTDDEWHVAFGQNGEISPRIDLSIRRSNWAVGSGASGGAWLTSISSDDYAVLTIRKKDKLGEFYINNQYIGKYDGYATPIYGYWFINPGYFWFKYIATIPRAMTDAEITAKISELMATYGI